jgi:hypothetical protein
LNINIFTVSWLFAWLPRPELLIKAKQHHVEFSVRFLWAFSLPRIRRGLSVLERSWGEAHQHVHWATEAAVGGRITDMKQLEP